VSHKFSEERNQWVVQEMERRLAELIRTANSLGVVLTIETVPQLPLPMGNHQMVGHVRPARGNY
jgi:hypothetical protein